MSVNIFKPRWMTDCHPRTKNGQPAHSTTGVVRTKSNHCQARGEAHSPSDAKKVPLFAMVITSTGTVRTTLIQNRRVIYASSGFFSSSRLIVRGSRAMPHLGHDPGLFVTISGCMGHVYSFEREDTGTG